MKKIILAGLVAMSFSVNAIASEVGLYFGDGTLLDYSSHSLGTTQVTFNGHWLTKDTGDTYASSQLSFKSFGFGLGFASAGIMDNLVVMAAVGYGLSNVEVDNSNLASIDYNTGAYYQIGANYQVSKKLPITVGVKLLSIPTFDWTTSTGPKTYGGTSLLVGASLAF